MGVSSCENPIYRVLLPNGYITHSRNVAIGNIDQRQPDVIFPTIFDFVQTKTHGDSETVQLEEALRAFEDTVPTDDELLHHQEATNGDENEDDWQSHDTGVRTEQFELDND